MAYENSTEDWSDISTRLRKRPARTEPRPKWSEPRKGRRRKDAAL